MKKQTYILEVWHGAATFTEAGKKEISGDKTAGRNFFRFAYKKASTVKKALKNYVSQAEYKGLQFLYPSFFAPGGKYRIVSTPDGYNEDSVIEEGYIKDVV